MQCQKRLKEENEKLKVLMGSLEKKIDEAEKIFIDAKK
ncbi:unnamed protein product [Rhodiola kirilowii]